MEPQTPQPPVPNTENQTIITSGYKPRRRINKRAIIFGSLVIFLVLAAAGGIYSWQHGKVNTLSKQVSSLKNENDSLKKQLADKNSGSPDDQNGGLSLILGQQQKVRDTEREMDISTMHTQLEAFYAQSGFYPRRADINSATWRAVNMKSLDPEALKDPQSTSAAGTLASTPAAKIYAYTSANEAGTSCENDKTTCMKYTLTATLEGTLNGAKTLVKENLN
jgi:hypothetical protein